MKKTLSIILALALIFSFACSAFADAASEPTEIVFWHNFTDHHAEVLETIAQNFNALQSDYVVSVYPQPKSEYYSKLLQASVAGIGPNIAFGYASDIGEYVRNDMVLNFTPYIDDPEIGIPEFRESISEGLYKEITQWGNDAVMIIPTAVTSQVLFYNKTIYDELGLTAPETWEDIENNARVITEAKGIPGWGSDDPYKIFTNMVIQDGAAYIDEETASVAFNNETGLNAIKWYADNVKEGIFRLVGEDMYFSNPFGSGVIGSYIGNSSGIQFVQLAIGDKFELGVAPIPTGTDNKYIPSSGASFFGFDSGDDTINKGSYLFMKYLISAEALPDWAVTFGRLPAYSWARDNDTIQSYIEDNLAISALNSELDAIGYISSMPGSEVIPTELNFAIESACNDLLNPQDALDQCAANCNASLQG